MLGKTNIVTTDENSLVTEIKDYKWISTKLNTNQNIVKAVYGNGKLVAITPEGTIAYTSDGENWECKNLGNYLLYDIICDDSQWIIVGGHESEGVQYGLIITSSNLIDFDISTKCTNASANNRFYGVSINSGKYIIIGMSFPKTSAGATRTYALIGNLINWDKDITISSVYISNTLTYTIDNFFIEVAKNTNGFIVYAKTLTTNDAYSHYVYSSSNGLNFNTVMSSGMGTNLGKENAIKVFCAKDELYYYQKSSTQTYKLYKLIGTNETNLVTSNINYQFTGAEYYNNSLVLINSHDMLVVKKGENLGEKNLTDMFEISYDYSFNGIVKAFDKLYILCNQGFILYSDSEGKDPETTAVITMSAKKALYDAKSYTDKKLLEMKAYVDSLVGSNVT